MLMIKVKKSYHIIANVIDAVSLPKSMTNIENEYQGHNKWGRHIE